jgi:hypothetical protein
VVNWRKIPQHSFTCFWRAEGATLCDALMSLNTASCQSFDGKYQSLAPAS